MRTGSPIPLVVIFVVSRKMQENIKIPKLTCHREIEQQITFAEEHPCVVKFVDRACNSTDPKTGPHLWLKSSGPGREDESVWRVPVARTMGALPSVLESRRVVSAASPADMHCRTYQRHRK